MARAIESRRERIGEFNISAGTNDAYSQFGKAVKDLGEFAQEVTDPIARGIMIGEANKDRLAFEETQEGLPISGRTQAPGTNAFFGFTKWGKDYQGAYNALDEALIEHSASKKLSELALSASDPANMRVGATASYAPQAAEIVKAYSGIVRGDQTKVATELMAKAGQYELALAKHEQDYAYKALTSKLKVALEDAESKYQEAKFSDNELEAQVYADKIKASIYNMQSVNLLTPSAAQQALDSFDSQTRIIDGGSEFRRILREEPNLAAQRLEYDVRNPPEGMTYGEHQEMIKQNAESLRAYNSATAEYYANNYAEVMYGISTNAITTDEEISQIPLKPDDYFRSLSNLYNTQQSRAKAGLDLVYNQELINSGQSAAIPKSELQTMADSANKLTEQSTGVIMQPLERAASLIGDTLGGRIAPTSGVPNLSIGTNLPSFDAVLNEGLESGDPTRMINSFRAFNYLVSVRSDPNMVNLNSNAQLIAVQMKNSILGGDSEQQAAMSAAKILVESSDAVIQQRTRDFTSTQNINSLESSFKSIFGASANGNATAFSNFKHKVWSNVAMGADQKSAIDSAALSMRAQGTSKYFVPGMVGDGVPEVELPIASMGPILPNQIAVAVQVLKNKTQAFDWADPADEIDLSTFKTKDWIAKPLPAVRKYKENQTEVTLTPAIGPFGLAQQAVSELFPRSIMLETKMPRIKINGAESDVYLTGIRDTRYGASGGLVYTLVYIDKSGIIQQLIDPNNHQGDTAQFFPATLTSWVPAEALNQQAKMIKEILNQSRQAPAKQAAKELARDLAIRLGLPGMEKESKLKEMGRDVNPRKRLTTLVKEIMASDNEDDLKALEARLNQSGEAQ